jgi:hypothetical protein
MILGPTEPGRAGDDPQLPTPAAVIYVATNAKRPSFNTLPPNAANEAINISF